MLSDDILVDFANSNSIVDLGDELGFSNSGYQFDLNIESVSFANSNSIFDLVIESVSFANSNSIVDE